MIGIEKDVCEGCAKGTLDNEDREDACNQVKGNSKPGDCADYDSHAMTKWNQESHETGEE